MVPRAGALLLALCLAAGPASAAWTSFHGDERNTGHQASGTFGGLGEVWWRTTLSPRTHVEATPVTAEGVVIVADWSGLVRALRTATGEEVWRHAMSGKVVGTPAISGSRVFAVDTNGQVKALDLRTGAELARATIGPTFASPTVHEGKLFIGNEAGDMNAFDTRTLTLLWRFNVGSVSVDGGKEGSCQNPIPKGQVRGAAAVYEGTVVFASLNNWVYAVSEQGEPGQHTRPLWVFESQDVVFASPVIDHANKRVLVGSYDERLHAMPVKLWGTSAVTGGSTRWCNVPQNDAAWSFTVPSGIGNSKVHATPATDGSLVYVGAQNGRLFAIDARTGEERWRYATSGAIIASPAVANGRVVVASDDGRVHFLHPNGTIQAKVEMGGPILANVAVDDGSAYIASFDGVIVRAGPERPGLPNLRLEGLNWTDGKASVTVRNAGSKAAAASATAFLVDGVEWARLATPALQRNATLRLEVAVPATSS
ncbi:MAG TPA: PQQ-binding-like beta-propeller repeat protein, partial [Candidatus Thermoplasmatota archaeon]|nr:PQQ-binding-like beta-propeller repeat protein [Candidatus Thermoplasmatota archaeon]